MIKNLSFFKKSFGVSLLVKNFSIPKNFGLPASRGYAYSQSHFGGFYLNDFVNFFEMKASKALNVTVLSNPSFFGLGLRRYLSKRIKVLKFNRSYRGVRHSQSLPVRGQRSKTNSRTQKSRRR